MRLAFCLNYFFPYGGLQRDFIQIAERARDRGHDVDVYAMEWHGDFISGIKIHLMTIKSFTNHGRCLKFTKMLLPILRKKQYDCVIGFNKLPGLDVYYAADPCFKAKHIKTSWFKKWMPRYQYYERFEKVVFDKLGETHILYLSEVQKKWFQTFYETPDERFHALPPPINPDRKPTAHDYEASELIRKQYLGDASILLLSVASAFKTKGIDRSLAALAALSRDELQQVQLLVIGEDEHASYLKLAKKLQIESQVKFLGAVDKVVPFYLASDLFLHPARVENTGTVLLEAMLSGLAIITTDNCGYAEYVKAADAGIVLDEPFEQPAFNEALHLALFKESNMRQSFGERGKIYADAQDFFSMPLRAMKVIEDVVKAN